MLARGANDDVAVLTVSVRVAIPLLSARRPLDAAWVFRADDARTAEDARAGFIAFLRTRGVPDANYAAAELVFGELIGNVVRHAPGPITVEVDWNAVDPVLHVIDRGPAYDAQAKLARGRDQPERPRAPPLSVLVEDLYAAARLRQPCARAAAHRAPRTHRVTQRITLPRSYSAGSFCVSSSAA